MLFLALSTLRARKGAFVGAFVALLCAAALVTACGALLDTGLRGQIPTERYAAAPVLVTADQETHWLKEKGGGKPPKLKSKALPERAWLDAGVAKRLAGIEGVRGVVPELTFPAQVLAGGERGGKPSFGHAWSSAVLTPFALREGRAPTARDEVVADSGAGLRTGTTVVVQSTGAPAAYRVVGIAVPQQGQQGRQGQLERQSALFFAEGEARRLAGRPGQVAVIGLLTRPGTDVSAVREKAVAALRGTAAKVRVGDERGPVEFLDAEQARVRLVSMGGAMGGTSLLVALLVVTGTFTLSVQQRMRELALLRAVGATPKQLRGMVGREAVAVGLLAGVPGALAGLLLARWMYGRFVAMGVLPDTLELTLSAFPPLAAVLATLGAAWGAARVSARRPARVKPTEGLAQAAVQPAGLGKVRAAAGVLAAVGYAVLTWVLGGLRTDAAATPVTFLSVILATVAIALLGPVIARAAMAVLGAVARRLSPAAGFLAAENTRANAHRLAAVVTPLSLAVAMASTVLFTQTTVSHAAGEQARAGTTAPYVLSAAGPGVPAAAAAAVRKVPGVSAVTEVVRTTVRAGQDKFPAQGASSVGLGRTVDPGVVAGSFGAMRAGGTVAVSELAADIKGVGVGDSLQVTLGDGFKASVRVVAVYQRGLGFGDLVLPHGLVAAHVDNPLASSVLVAGTAQADALRAAVRAYPAVHVQDRTQVAAARSTRDGNQAQVNYLTMGLIIAFTSIAVVNTLVMATTARRREFTLLRMIGTTGRQLRAMLRWETLAVTLLSVVLGTGVAYATLSSYATGMTGTSVPYAPPLVYVAVVAVAAVLAHVATAVPARAARRGALVG